MKKIQEKDDKETRKLTGRELFLTDKTLNESDLKFLEDGKFLYLIAFSFTFYKIISWTSLLLYTAVINSLVLQQTSRDFEQLRQEQLNK